MAKPYDTLLIMMVAQKWFETAELNQFCKLIPIVYVDGSRPTPEEFPNDGEIWWMLTARTGPLAVPGKLVVGKVEDAIRYDEGDPNSSLYQVHRESVRDPDLKEAVEVVMIPGDAVDSIQDVVSTGFRIDLPSPPVPAVMLQWRGDVYGLFRAVRNTASTPRVNEGFAFTPANADMTVYQIADRTFGDAIRDHRFWVEESVSLTSSRRSEAYDLEVIKHDLVLAAGYDRIFRAQPKKMVLEPIERKLQRYAKKCLSRRKAADLRALLDELELTGREAREAEDLVNAVNRIRRVTESQEAALDNVAKAMLESGMLGADRIWKAEQAFADKYVQDQAAQLQAKAQVELTAIGEQIQLARVDLKNVQARLQKEEAEHRAHLDKALAIERETAQKAIAAERNLLESQKLEFERQQQVLQKNLEHVTREMREAGDNVINRFLSIAPLLGAVRASSGLHPSQSTAAPMGEEAAVTKATFEMPSYVRSARPAEARSLAEEVFFDRFKRVVEESGFVYRRLDLQRFHLSVKCGEMTVLGGPSGTGKSSLPALYAQSLLGEEAGRERRGCLMVNVNPSWMDIRDLLGHMNTLEGKYYPAESGLFQDLVYAQEEYRAKGAATGLYLVCLDEMNLSQVEHYFSDFMMVLDREEPARVIQCFPAEVAKTSCPFLPYARLAVSPGVRFIGTVNFDETTRLLSDRFLDRVNLIRLTSGSLPTVSKSGRQAHATAGGRMVALADLEAWRADAALPADLGTLLDSMRPLLSEIGCPLSPRVYRGICRYVASAVPIMQAPAAFDVQIAQRVVPKVRGLVTKRQLESLDALLKLMNGAGICAFEESLPLLEAARDSAGTRAWDLEE